MQLGSVRGAGRAAGPCFRIPPLLQSDPGEGVNSSPVPGSPPPPHTHVKLTSRVPKLKSSGTDGGCHLSQGSWKLTSLPTEAQKEKEKKSENVV